MDYGLHTLLDFTQIHFTTHPELTIQSFVNHASGQIQCAPFSNAWARTKDFFRQPSLLHTYPQFSNKNPSVPHVTPPAAASMAAGGIASQSILHQLDSVPPIRSYARPATPLSPSRQGRSAAGHGQENENRQHAQYTTNNALLCGCGPTTATITAPKTDAHCLPATAPININTQTNPCPPPRLPTTAPPTPAAVAAAGGRAARRRRPQTSGASSPRP